MTYHNPSNVCDYRKRLSGNRTHLYSISSARAHVPPTKSILLHAPRSTLRRINTSALSHSPTLLHNHHPRQINPQTGQASPSFSNPRKRNEAFHPCHNKHSVAAITVPPTQRIGFGTSPMRGMYRHLQGAHHRLGFEGKLKFISILNTNRWPSGGVQDICLCGLLR